MKRILFLFAACMLALALLPAARAVIVDDGTTCPSAPAWTQQHDWRMTSSQQATCRSMYTETYTCAYCGKSITYTYGGYGDHVWGNYQQVAATCTEPGGMARVCAICGEREEMWEIGPLGHDFQYQYAKEPTCEADGYEYYACSRCGVNFTVLLPAPGHDWSDWITQQATCTEGGVAYRACARCGREEQAEPTEPLGHAPVIVEGKAPSCDEEGWTESSVCARCGAVLKARQDLPAKGHSYGRWKTEIPGTCVQKEMKVRVCSVCGHEDYFYFDYGDHDWGEWQVVEPPTAGQDGLRERVCLLDPRHKEQETIPAGTETAHPAIAVSAQRAPDAGAGSPQRSGLCAVHAVTPGYEPADPAGYRLGEKYSTTLTVFNTGESDIPGCIVSCESCGKTHEMIGLAAGKAYVPDACWYTNEITGEDVERGYISLAPAQITWTDPDTGEEKTAYSNPLLLPVMGKTGLTLEMSLALAPANGEYFEEGERVEWNVTVTNTSGEPVRNVTVEDQGKIVGAFPEIAPGETVICQAPPTAVTEYDVIVGTITSLVIARGQNGTDGQRTYPSNPVSVPTNGHSPTPLPPIGAAGREARQTK